MSPCAICRENKLDSTHTKKKLKVKKKQKKKNMQHCPPLYQFSVQTPSLQASVQTPATHIAVKNIKDIS